MSYNKLLPLIKKTGSNLSPEQFQERVNIVFHDFEADSYDQMHNDMKESLQEQINLLIDDLIIQKDTIASNLRLLDVGCGTGLSTQILLNSKLGNHIDEITLLDTSPNMLKFAEKKAQLWNKKYTIKNNYIASLDEKFDVIMICSVLHHIPELEVFLSKINEILNQGGILIHLQDPNGDYLNDKIYLDRLLDFKNQTSKNQNKTIFSYFPKKWKNFVKRQIGIKTYIDLVNDKLISEKTIKKRMSADEIWSVTDIHVETKDNLENKGISFQFLKNQLPNFKLINQRSYGFFGLLKSDLPINYRGFETELITENQLNGRNISCIWLKK